MIVTKDQMNMPRVPSIIATGKVLFGFFEVRFLDESSRLVKSRFVAFGTFRGRQRLANLNVTVAGGRLGRFDADCHNGLFPTGQIKPVREDLLKFLFARNHMIRRQHRHHGRRGPCPHDCRSEGHSGTRIASDWFGDHVFFWKPGQLPPDFGRLDGVCDDQHILQRHHGRHPVNGLLKEGAFPKKRDQLLGSFLAADGPETFPAPAGHDDDVSVVVFGWLAHCVRCWFSKVQEFAGGRMPAINEFTKAVTLGTRSGSEPCSAI